ncbi:MAG: hypothetical protein LBH86_05570, partial [Oscillospiraceae bacterium]|nr:hypothetical protein [Oscillospiraceae bacterium]
KTETKTFDLIVRKQGIAEITLEGVDPRFAPGYPKVIFDEVIGATLKVKLNPGVASAEHPVIAYFVMDPRGIKGYDVLDVESILYGHVNSVSGTIYQVSVINEIIIETDNEYPFPFHRTFLDDGWVTNFGIVLLADDNMDDPNAVATVFSAVTNEANDDELGPILRSFWGHEAVFNTAGDAIYLYFGKKLENTAANLPRTTDFEIFGASNVTVTAVDIDHNPEMGENDRQTSWLVLSLSHSIPIENQGAVWLSFMNSDGDFAYAIHADGFSLGGFICPLSPATQTLSVHINPIVGRLSLEFTPALQMPVENPQAFLNHIISSFRYNGVPILTECIEPEYFASPNQRFVDYSALLFAFEPIFDENITANDFTLTVASDLVNVAFDLFTSPQPSISILSFENMESTTASYMHGDSFSSILVHFPSDVHIGHLGNAAIPACNFILRIDGERVLLRGHTEASFSNLLALPLFSERIVERLSRATSVTLEYDFDVSGHDYYLSKLIDCTWIYFPNFGPISVTGFGSGSGGGAGGNSPGHSTPPFAPSV